MSNSLRAFLAGLLLVFPALAVASSNKLRDKSSRDISAIGHRDLGCTKGTGNWYTVEQQKTVGAQMSAAFEGSNDLLRDPQVTSYIENLTQKIAANSDAKFPITPRIVDTAEVYAITFPGGYQYLSRGLLLQLQNEGELAAALARGIAHTAMCTEAQLQTRANLAHLSSAPLIFTGGPSPGSKSAADLSVPLTMLKVKREFELQADYFGIQYLYKSGYNAESFMEFVQKVWPQPPPGTSVSTTFSAFPTLDQRLEVLERGIKEILPKRDNAVTDTQEFARFRERLLKLSPLPRPVPESHPTDQIQPN